MEVARDAIAHVDRGQRANVNRILQEQKYQAIFGPMGNGERVKLGKL
jgi:hypothetical protein